MHGEGYTALAKLGKSPHRGKPMKRSSMPRATVLIIILVLIVGALIFLSSQAREVPTATIETDVSPVANAS